MARTTTPKLTDLETAFQVFQNRIDALALPGNAAGPVATPAQMQEFAAHLAEAGDAFRAYAAAVHAAMADISTTHIPNHTGALEDVVSDMVGALRRAGRRMQEAA